MPFGSEMLMLALLRAAQAHGGWCILRSQRIVACTSWLRRSVERHAFYSFGGLVLKQHIPVHVPSEHFALSMM